MAKQREIEEDREIEIKINVEILECLSGIYNICGEGDDGLEEKGRGGLLWQQRISCRS